MSQPIQQLLALMRRLRDPNSGCPWDREQTSASIASCTLEEAYEVVDAIQRRDVEDLKQELGDLLFQVVFHAQIAQAAGEFDFDAVATAICDKLIRRHPHVFASAGAMNAAQQSAAWENIKAAERQSAAASGEFSHLQGVPMALPALMRAEKLSKRAARVGFDWQQASQTADKVAEELAEVRAAARSNRGPDPSPEVIEEVGDLLFAAANLARKLGVDAEGALRAANAKFEYRFRLMEKLAAQQGRGFESLSLAAQEALWEQAKRA